MLILISMIVVATATFAVVTLRYGAESRPGFDERVEGERFGVLR